MKTEQLTSFIKSITENQIFGVTFTKKNGDIRDMTCRLNVTKHLKGGELNFDPVEKGLLPVYDLVKKGYRMISLATVTELRAGGEVYRFN